ncbi:MAG: NADH-quinone oxidoreductase subunit N, partial [Methylobacteriaceae bacterium]|nr:NADH-quinone oxidoreductase subunit N [Methylobacteriaceae bacterium]
MSGFSFVLAHAFPEFLLVVGALILILVGAVRGERSGWLVTELAVGLLALAIVATFLSSKASAEIFDGAFIDDRFARFMKILALLGSLITLIMSQEYMRRARLEQFEFPVLVILSTIGMQVLISANSLIALYLGLELMSLALYVVAAFNRDDLRASEAGLKYFVLGALSSGMMLYGASLLYGFAGTVTFPGIAAAVTAAPSTGVIFGLVFLMVGLAFKMSTVPFHMWTPDVYEGAPTPVTAFFAAAPKVAAV